MDKEKYLKYKYKYLRLKNNLQGGNKELNYKFSKNLITDINLKIKDHKNLSFNVFPKDEKLYNDLSYMFKEKGNDIILISSKWGENYKKKKSYKFKYKWKRYFRYN